MASRAGRLQALYKSKGDLLQSVALMSALSTTPDNCTLVLPSGIHESLQALQQTFQGKLRLRASADAEDFFGALMPHDQFVPVDRDLWGKHESLRSKPEAGGRSQK